MNSILKHSGLQQLQVLGCGPEHKFFVSDGIKSDFHQLISAHRLQHDHGTISECLVGNTGTNLKR